MRKGCEAGRVKALLVEWTDTRPGKPPMRAYTGLEVCAPCAWLAGKSPVTKIVSEKLLKEIRDAMAATGQYSPSNEATVRYCDVTHPEYRKFRTLRGLK